MTGTVTTLGVSYINSVYRDISAFGAQPQTALTDFYRNTSGSVPPNFVPASQSSVPTSGTFSMSSLLNTFNGHAESVTQGFVQDGSYYWRGTGSPTGTGFGWSFFMQTATAGAGFIQPVFFSLHDYGQWNGGILNYLGTYFVVEGDVRVGTLGNWWTYLVFSWSGGERYLYRAEASENYQPFNPKVSPNEYVAWQWYQPGDAFPYLPGAGATVRLYK